MESIINHHSFQLGVENGSSGNTTISPAYGLTGYSGIGTGGGISNVNEHTNHLSLSGINKGVSVGNSFNSVDTRPPPPPHTSLLHMAGNYNILIA